MKKTESRLGQNSQQDKPVLGISECLMGSQVRYNGGHKRSRFCMDVLSGYFEFKGFCPEVGIGLGTPRPAIRQQEVNGEVKVIVSDKDQDAETLEDYGPALAGYADVVAPQLNGASGYIFMQKSPSCGLGSSKIYAENGYPSGSMDGAFASAIKERFPLLPVTEAGQLNDGPIRENFIASVYAYHDWQTKVVPELSLSSVLAFHRRHKVQLLSHDEHKAGELGRMLADAKKENLEKQAESYIVLFMDVMRKHVPRKRQAKALESIYRFLKKSLTDSERKESLSLIQFYRQGVVPYAVPMTLLRFLLGKYKGDQAKRDLDFYPYELGLQNAI